MLLHTFNYFSTSSPYKLRYVSYRGNSFFMPSSKKFATPVLHNVFVSCSLLRLSSATSFLRWRHKCWCMIGIANMMLENFPFELFKRPLLFSSRALVLLLWTTDAISSHSLRSLHLHHTSKIRLWISTGRTILAFMNSVTHRTSHVAVFSCSSLQRLGAEKIWNCTTQHTCSS